MTETTQDAGVEGAALGDAFASPLGDRRERPVRCRRCGRETWALRAICPPCIETNSKQAGEVGAAHAAAETKENQP